MKTPPGPVRMPGKAKPEAKGTSRASKARKDTRYIDIHEGDGLDEAQMATWVKQAAALPGWVPGRPS